MRYELYEKLLDILKNEHSNELLQPLDKKFYNDVINYLQELIDSMSMSQEEIHRTLILKELQNIKNTTSKIINLRVKKIFHLIIQGVDIKTSYITEIEEEIFTKLSSIFKRINELTEFSSISKKSTVQSKSEKIILRFLKPIPKIICSDLKSYGPFISEDIANLPAQEAEKLIERKVAVRIYPFSR